MEILPVSANPGPRAVAANTAAPAARFDPAVQTNARPDNASRPSGITRWRPDGEDGAQDDVPSGDLGLADLLDVVNPLQHVPVVASFYRVLTGDTITGAAQIVGDTLYGGALGMVSGVIKAIATQVNGSDPGDTLVANLLGVETPSEVDVAKADTAPDTASLAPAAGSIAGSGPVAAAAPAEAPEASVQAQALAPSSQPLTGQAALAAFISDMRAQAHAVPPQGETPMPAAVTGGDEPNAQPVAQTDSRADTRALGAAVPAHAFTAQMMEGLDKYRALTIERGGMGRPEPAHLDQDL
jgi:hypothetical protein